MPGTGLTVVCLVSHTDHPRSWAIGGGTSNAFGRAAQRIAIRPVRQGGELGCTQLPVTGFG
jgi:hypothetical protein